MLLVGLMKTGQRGWRGGGEATDQAGVCVKVPGFCVVRTHSQVLNSSDMM